MKRFLLFTIASLCLFSCQKAPFLTLNTPSSISFSEQGGSQDIIFMANRDWTATSSETWCKVSPSSGSSEEESNTFKITCEQNTTYDPRSCTVTIKVEGLTEVITVSQETNRGLLVSPTEYNLSNEAQTVEVEVRANIQYIVDIDSSCKDWIKHTSTRGLATNRLILEIGKNENYDVRLGSITIRQSDGPLAETINVKQGQSYGLFITSPEYEVSNESQTLSVEVQANVEYEVTPMADWIHFISTRGLKTSTITLNVDKNSAYEERVGTVQVKQKDGDLSGIITITQKQLDGLFVSPDKFNLDNTEQEIEIAVNNNVSFSIVIPDDAKSWITVKSNTATRSLVEDRVILTISKNTTFDDREASISFKETDGPLTQIVRITQHQTDGLFISDQEYNLSNENQALNIAVQANVDYEVTPEVGWIHFVETRALRTSTIILSIDANDVYDSRTGTVLVRQKGGDESVKITINQSERFGLFTNPDLISVSGDAQRFDIQLSYNVEYEIIIPEDAQSWLSVETATNTRGLLTNSLSFSVTENNTYNKRKAKVTIKQINGLVSSDFSIVQDTKELYTPLTFEAYDVGYVSINNPLRLVIEYNKNDDGWVASDNEIIHIGLIEGEIVQLRGNNLAYSMKSSELNSNSHTNIQVLDCYAYGNTLSLIGSNDYATRTRVEDFAFCGLFSASRLINHPQKELLLPASEVGAYAYYKMFQGSYISRAPSLPSKKLSAHCYSWMFAYCKNLTTTKDLPATDLALECYADMFHSCSSLTNAPELSATVLAQYCCGCMFYDCIRLKEAPSILPATTLAAECYSEMFNNCISLTKTPKLPATTLAYRCYAYMFCHCISLNHSPQLPATTLATCCYSGMFYDCSSLSEAPQLPATTLADACYSGMFNNCASLSEAPQLPATTLANGCYEGMFSGCLSLAGKTHLPARNLVSRCYIRMFYGCSKFDYLSADFITTPNDFYTEGWLTGVSSSGTFIKNSEATWDVRGENGIPEGWAVIVQ